MTGHQPRQILEHLQTEQVKVGIVLIVLAYTLFQLAQVFVDIASELDAVLNDSGKVVGNDKGISKVGSAVLRRTLFLIMTVILQTRPQDEPIYSFMDKKRSEGKPYKVYMMASANKFLRIYYAKVKAVMDSASSN